MLSLRSRLAVAAVAVASFGGATSIASADAEAATVKIRAVGSSELLTDTASIGFVTMKAADSSRQDQKWIKVATSNGNFVLRNVATGRCLEGNDKNPFFVRTKTCSVSNFAQQWNRGFIGDGRIQNRAFAKALTANFQNINHVVEFRPYLGLAGQKWVISGI